MIETIGTAGDHLDDETAPVEVADKPREPTPYEVKLRRENANARTRLRAAEAAVTVEKETVTRIKAEAEAEVARVKTQAEADAGHRIIRAELKAAALAAGMKKTEYLKLIDVSAIKLDADGEVVLPENFFDKAKERMPELFGVAAASTSVAATPPSKEAAVEKKASEMTPAEIRAWKTKNGIR